MRNFTREEFACNCDTCHIDTVDYELARVLDTIRDHFNAPVRITSGVRCPKYNKAVGGSEMSQHMFGRAADIVVEGVTPKDVADFAEELDVGGLGRYSHFTHVDTRSGPKARWGHNA